MGINGPRAQEERRRAEALYDRAYLHLFRWHDPERALDAAKEAESIFRALGEKEDLGDTLALKTYSLYLCGDSDGALAASVEGEGILRELGNLLGVARILLVRGTIEVHRPGHALTALVEAEDILRQLGDRVAVAGIQVHRALMLSELEQYQAALALYEEAEGTLRGLGEMYGLASALVTHGDTLHRLSDNDNAALLKYEEAAEIFRSLGDRDGFDEAMEGCISVCSQRGDTEGQAPYRENLVQGRVDIDNRVIERLESNLTEDL